ncbi:hypothetical protein HJ588_13505 [Flexivirga sp. ID2601S]|uniref:Uncharacterized protein n=1 Tax=Flexivirga aerilata TaxID=1656889 RepID=A0A849AU92_9MICO|nr:hypothetical protein [Flexivirga aerilata]NNG40282.1 hypothetical protein [Flexivirga aerilata]
MPSLPTRALFTQLIDDAAVFPPGNFPLDEAIERRAGRRGTPASDFVGPLLLPPALVDDALADPGGLVITVVGRAGTPITDVIDAATRVADSPAHALAGVEVPAADGWQEAIKLSVPIAVEVPAGSIGLGLLADLAGPREEVVAKLRTGATASNTVPSTDDLAAFITGCVHAGLAFKLTGGLHHAISTTVTTGHGAEDQFGFLNVLLATDAALREGDPAALLDSRDTEAITAALAGFSEARAVTTRNSFSSFGCCNVLDPIDDLTTLGLI